LFARSSLPKISETEIEELTEKDVFYDVDQPR
jgi:hypothetical protein